MMSNSAPYATDFPSTRILGYILKYRKQFGALANPGLTAAELARARRGRDDAGTSLYSAMLDEYETGMSPRGSR